MNFFTAFSDWLQAQLADYIAARTAQMAALIEPLLVACAVLYLMVWAWLQITGRIEEPILEGAKRIVILAAIFGTALHLWSYNAYFVDTFADSPQIIASALGSSGTTTTVAMADSVLTEGITVSENLFKQGGILSASGWVLGIVGAIVYVAVILTAVYAAFLDALARIALAVILALGPLFLVGLLFDSTRRFFESWVAQLANYALVTILTGAIAGLVMQIIRNEAAELVALGTEVQIAQAVPLLVACVLVMLLLRQVMPMAASLASGVGLSSMGAVSVALSWSMSRSARFARGSIDSDTSRWDPLSRKLGYHVASPVRAVVRRALGLRTRNPTPAAESSSAFRPRNEIRRVRPR